MFEKSRRAKEAAHLLNRDVHLKTTTGQQFVGLLYSVGPKVFLVWREAGHAIGSILEWSEVQSIEPSLVVGEKNATK